MADRYLDLLEKVQATEDWKKRTLAALEGAPARPRRRALPRALAVAAACAALFASALAVSPGLTERLFGILGSYAAYTQPVEDAVCVVDGIELRVLSAMADNAVVKVYAQVQDLTGQGRLGPDLEVNCVIQRAEDAKEGHEGASTTHGGECVAFDETAGTALLELSAWGAYDGRSWSGGQEEMVLRVFSLYPQGYASGALEFACTLPLELEILPSRVVALSGTVGTVRLKELYLSELGPSLLFEQEAESVLQYQPFAVYLADGTVCFPQWEGGGGFGLTEDGSELDGRMLECWAFQQPVDPEEVVGISLAYWYIPIDGAAAGPGHWLPSLPAAEGGQGTEP